jgi:hypothetical protein
MCLKVFSLKNPNFRNPVSALFKQLMITVFGFLDGFMRPIIEKKMRQRDEEKLKLTEMKENINLSENTKEKVIELEDNNHDDNNIHENYESPKESLLDTKKENKSDEEVENNKENEENNNINHDEINHDNDEHMDKEDKEVVVENSNEEIKNITNNNKNNDNKIVIDDVPINKEKNDEIDLSEFTNFEIYQTSLALFKNLILITEGKKKEWISVTIYSKCLGLELLSGVIRQTGWVLKHLPEFLELIKNDLYKIVKKNFEITNDYIMGLKLARISIQIVESLNICYDLIPFLLKYSEHNQLNWQKLVGLECLSSLCQNNLVLRDLYDKRICINEEERMNVYDEIINSLTKVSYAMVTSKTSEIKSKKDEKKDTFPKNQKIIEMSSILTEADIAIPTLNSTHVFKLLNECYTNLKDSFIIILEIHGLKLGKINRSYNEEQLLVKDMLNYNYEQIKNALTALLVNSTDDSVTQSYLVLFQSYINIYGSIALPVARDSYLNDLCKLAIPNNLENSLEMKDKNLLITKALFNIAHCFNILDFNSWFLLLDTMQKIYMMLLNSNNHMLKPSEEFEIDVIIKNLEGNIKKYNPNYMINEEKSVLKNVSYIPEERKSLNNMNNNNLDDDKKSVNSMNINNNINDDNTSQNMPNTAREINTNSNSNNNSSTTEKKKGIFFSIKNAFGFSKTAKTENTSVSNNTVNINSNNTTSQNSNTNNNSNKNKSQQQNNIDENVDLQIVSAAIDTLFINSTTYDDSTLKDITKAILESSKHLISTNNIINDNVITYLHFNLTKMLELSVINVNRIEGFWDIVIEVVTYICSKNINNISRFSLDCLTIIDMFILTQYKCKSQNNDDLNNEEENSHQVFYEQWSKEVWQKTIFIPFINIASSNISQTINMNIIYNLSKILQNCGQLLNSSGWTSFIKSCEILIAKSDELLCDNSKILILI